MSSWGLARASVYSVVKIVTLLLISLRSLHDQKLVQRRCTKTIEVETAGRMGDNPNDRRHARSGISDADFRAEAQLFLQRTSEWMNSLTDEQLANFTIRLYIQQHPVQFGPQALTQPPAQGNQVLTGEILVDRAREWMVNLPPDQFLRHSIKGYLDQYFDRMCDLLLSQGLSARRFQARSQTLSQAPLRQAPSEAPRPARVQALRQAAHRAPPQVPSQAPLQSLSRTLSRAFSRAPRPAPSQARIQAAPQVNNMALCIPEHQTGYAR